MLQTAISGYYNSGNEFKIKEIYISDDEVLYVLKRDESFFPVKYEGNVKGLYDSVKNSYYPNFHMSEPRQYDDNDPKSLATFFMNKINEFDIKKSGSEKKIYDILVGFGSELE